MEATLRQCPGINRRRVVSLPRPDGSEEVVGAVTVTEGSSSTPKPSAATAAPASPHARSRAVVVVEDLPRSMIGKVLHREVRDSLLHG